MEEKSPAPEPTSPPIPWDGGKAPEGGVPIAEADRHPGTRAPSKATGPLSSSPAAIREILDDLHGFIAHGELLLGELVCDPSCLAPPKSIVRLDDWLFYVTSRAFPELVDSQPAVGKIPVKPKDFSIGAWLSAVMRHLDHAAIKNCLVQLNQSIEKYNEICPLRAVARLTGPNIGRCIEIGPAKESKSPKEKTRVSSPPPDEGYDLWLASK